MTRATGSPRRRGWRAILVLATIALAGSIAPASSMAAEPGDMVLRWQAHAIAAIGNAGTATPPGLGQPPPLAPIHLAMVQTAVYDAVNAIDGGHAPYLDDLPSAPASASKAAAAATAAHGVLVGLAATSSTVVASLDGLLVSSLAEIDAGAAKTAGIAIGQAAAAAMLAERTGDGRTGTRGFTLGDAPGEWVLVPPLSNNVFAWIADVEPFALRSSGQFRVQPPPALTSEQYAIEFNEVKALGRQTGSTRTAAQTSLAGWASGNPFVFMNKGLRDIATAEGLSTAEQARLLAMTSMSSADALIACWDNKGHYNVWRPQTAIRAAATDGNPATTADPDWLSLIPNPGYPDLPSGFNCLTAGIMYAARLYFESDRMSFQLTSPGITAAPPNVPVGVAGSTRTYTRFSDVIRDSIEGRILNGLHFRHADVQGAWIGKKAAQWLERHEFQPVD
jgi:hypothetical protein